MFGHHNDHPVAASAKAPSQQEVAHQFDQTNGVMKAFDDYQARSSSVPPVDKAKGRDVPMHTKALQAGIGGKGIGGGGTF